MRRLIVPLLLLLPTLASASGIGGNPWNNRIRGSASYLGVMTPVIISSTIIIPAVEVVVEVIVAQPDFNVTAGVGTVWTHTAGGTNRMLTVNLAGRNLGGAASNWSVSIDGTLATKAVLTQTTELSAGVWYLINPSVGVHTIRFHNDQTMRGVGATISYTGVYQGGSPVDATAGSTGTGTPVTSIITATAGSLETDVAFGRTNPTTLTVGVGQIQMWNIVNAGGPPNQFGTGAGSNMTATGGVDTLSWTLGGSGDNWVQSVVAWTPAPVP